MYESVWMYMRWHIQAKYKIHKIDKQKNKNCKVKITFNPITEIAIVSILTRVITNSLLEKTRYVHVLWQNGTILFITFFLSLLNNTLGIFFMLLIFYIIWNDRIIFHLINVHNLFNKCLLVADFCLIIDALLATFMPKYLHIPI